jgi:hypothetical protein
MQTFSRWNNTQAQRKIEGIDFFETFAPVVARGKIRIMPLMSIIFDRTTLHIDYSIKFNVIYFNCAFTELIVPKAGNITLATMPARESWVRARLSHSCSQSVGLIAVTVTTVSVVFCTVQI